ncbi:hypothetical protein [Microbacterium sp.]|uniref:hypothetical protein n=1 Tax=Microbacterium sp. TaxID=51671 RepID=UPI0039E33B35
MTDVLPPPTAMLVRAVVRNPALVADFDRWYDEDHLPQALSDFGAHTASRWWSYGEESVPVHYAIYEFTDAAALEAALAGAAIAALIAEFSRLWGADVERVRSRARLAQRLTTAD